MRKPTDYTERMIEQLESQLKKELIESISYMLEDNAEWEDTIERTFNISASETVTAITPHYDDDLECVGKVEVSYEYFEDDGCIYSTCDTLDKFNVSQLLIIWNRLKCED